MQESFRAGRLPRSEPHRSGSTGRSCCDRGCHWEGQTVQFHLRDAKSAATTYMCFWLRIEQSTGIPTRGPPVQLLRAWRGTLGQPHHDSGVVQERLGPIPTAGFFAQGDRSGRRAKLSAWLHSECGYFLEPDSSQEHSEADTFTRVSSRIAG